MPRTSAALRTMKRLGGRALRWGAGKTEGQDIAGSLGAGSDQEYLHGLKSGYSVNRKKAVCFFEKKHQKTFAKPGFGLSGPAEAKMIKRFLLLFFQKSRPLPRRPAQNWHRGGRRTALMSTMPEPWPCEANAMGQRRTAASLEESDRHCARRTCSTSKWHTSFANMEHQAGSMPNGAAWHPTTSAAFACSTTHTIFCGRVFGRCGTMSRRMTPFISPWPERWTPCCSPVTIVWQAPAAILPGWRWCEGASTI